MEQVADHIYRLGTRAHNFYIIPEEDQATVIDLGCRREWGKFTEGLDTLGLVTESVAGALVTHAHGDHIGLGKRANREGITVSVHRDEETRALGNYVGKASATAFDLPLYRLATWKAMLPMALLGVTSWKPLATVGTFDDGVTLDLPGRPRAVHTPGHTEGHVMFHCADLGVLFTGDGLATMDLVGERSGPQLMANAFNNNTDLALDSLDRLDDIDAGLVLPGHGEPFVGSPAEAAELARRTQ